MPVRYQVRIAKWAERDIEAIWSFIAADSPDEANRFVFQLEKQVHALGRFPERCPLIPENELLAPIRQKQSSHVR